MPEARHSSLAWLGPLLSAAGLGVDRVLHPDIGDGAPRTDYGPDLANPTVLPLSPGSGPAWHESLRRVAAESWTVALVNTLTISSPQGPSRMLEGAPLRGGPAVLATLLESMEPGRTIVALVPAAMLRAQSAAPWRGWVSTAHRLELIAWMGPAAAALTGLHKAFEMALVVITAGAGPSEGVRLLRLADLTGVELEEAASRLKGLARRQGGERDSTSVARDPSVDGAPWTYERFSGELERRRDDLSGFGQLSPLADFLADIRVGLHLKPSRMAASVEGDALVTDETLVPCYGGAAILRDGRLGEPPYALPRADVPEDLLLQRGDILVRALVGKPGPGQGLVLAEVYSGDEPATFGSHVLRLRWKEDIPPRTRELVLLYLRSSHAWRWLEANGAGIHLAPALLGRLEVPLPSEAVAQALDLLDEAQDEYSEWAMECARARLEIFEAASIREAVPALLLCREREQERLRAARESQSLEHKVRNHYPHPIALRYENVRLGEPGADRIPAILECAEYLVDLLAVAAVIQMAPDHSLAAPAPSPQLRKWAETGRFTLDWGKAADVVRGAIDNTRRHADPLSLPFPGFALLAPDDETPVADSQWCRAEEQLRTARNEHAHLHRLPPLEMAERSEAFLQSLRTLLSGASFLGTSPLVQVRDYRLQLSGERHAEFLQLQGVSPAFPRVSRVVTAELPRDAVGWLDDSGAFRPAHPFVRRHLCETCQRGELFLFNRFERGTPGYVAMETGHPQESPELAPAARRLLGLGE